MLGRIGVLKLVAVVELDFAFVLWIDAFDLAGDIVVPRIAPVHSSDLARP